MNMRNLHYYALTIISYQNIAGPRRKVSDVVWVVYEYSRRRDDCGEDGWGWGRLRGGREKRLSTLCPWHEYICADIHAVRFIFSWCSSSRTLCARARVCGICVRMCSPSFDVVPHVRAPAFNATWPYNSNVETPLTGTRIPDITFTHVIPHQFLETKATNIWWREWTRCGLVDEVRASISPGPASNFLLLPFVPFPLFLLIYR